jgi:hypothetical protein
MNLATSFIFLEGYKILYFIVIFTQYTIIRYFIYCLL